MSLKSQYSLTQFMLEKFIYKLMEKELPVGKVEALINEVIEEHSDNAITYTSELFQIAKVNAGALGMYTPEED